MSDDSNDEGDVYLDQDDIVRVIDLDDNQANSLHLEEGDGDDDADYNYNEEEDEEDAMETEGAIAAPTQDDSAGTFTGHQHEAVMCCQVHPCSSEMAVTGGQDDKAFVWNTKTGATLFECTGHSDTVTAIGFSADGSMVATADMKGLVQVWAIPSGALVWSFEVEELEWIQWHQVAPVLLAGTKDGQVWMWKIPSGDCKMLTTHGSSALCGRILPDGKHCCVGYEDGVVKIWDLKSTEATFTISGHDGHKSSVLCMDVKADPGLVITGSEDMTAKVINTASGKVLSTLPCGDDGQGDDQNSVEAVGLSAVNDYAATGTLNGQLQVWDLTTKSVRHLYQHPHGIVKVQWSSSSPIFYTASLDGRIRQFDSRSGQTVKTYQGHTAAILDFSVDREESFLLTASDDFTAKIFPIEKQMSS